MTVTDVIEAIDPMRNQVMIGFGRESTVLENGEYIKDMRYLNRNLKDVIVVEADPNKVKYQKENCIVLPLYTGDPDDSQLMDLLPLLECMLYAIKLRSGQTRGQRCEEGALTARRRSNHEI